MGDASPNVHVLDAAYKPFPTFSAWLRQVRVESGRWDRYQESLKESSQLSPEQLARAKNIAKRAAAFDTGAIEGLYDSDRGFTYTVAFETAAWEAAVNPPPPNRRWLQVTAEAGLIGHTADYLKSPSGSTVLGILLRFHLFRCSHSSD